ncbi:MAG TPA: LysR substrate-binding domain-containing protein [Rhodanobacteraceae bacterium]|nr:LysR substrate-binding domain-containing protein [Rhodanobacteraceae bacterium]
MIGISPRQLEVFAAVATHGSVRVAAEQLHLTQPAASMALAELERRLDIVLFDRAQRRLHLNARGRALLPLAREVLLRLQEIERHDSSATMTLSGELRIGTSNTVGNYRIGELLGSFVAAHPQVAVRLTVGNTAAVLAQLRDYVLDAACVEGTVADAALETIPWREDALAVCARPDHPLARRKRLRAANFAGARWILREPGSATRVLAERALAQLPAGETVLELDQTEAIKQAVVAGLGIACLPAVAVRDSVAAGRLVMLATPFLELRRTLQLVVGRGRYRGALLDAFLAAARAAAPPSAAVPPRRRRSVTA